MRALKARLDRIDILLVHDIDVSTHGSQEAADERIRELFDKGGYRALEELQVRRRRQGDRRRRERMAGLRATARPRRFRLLPARRPLHAAGAGGARISFLPLCEERGVGIILGGPFNSGILATGPVAGARYDYAPAPSDILAKVTRIEAVCLAHGVRLVEAALQFVLAHPAVTTVIPGAISPDQVKAKLRSCTPEFRLRSGRT